MNKFDKTGAIFRIVAVIYFICILTVLPSALFLFAIERTGFLNIIVIITFLGTPTFLAYLIWTRHEWLSDKVLEFIPGDEQIDTDGAEAAIMEVMPASESFTRMEIESIAFTILGAIILAITIPNFILAIYAYSEADYDIIYTLSSGVSYVPMLQYGLVVAIGLLLFLRPQTISGWLQQRREREGESE